MTLLAVLPLMLQVSAAPPPPVFCLNVDSIRSEVLLRVGPFRLPAEGLGDDAMARNMRMSTQQGEVYVQRFAWPLTAWISGYRVRLVDAQGRELPRVWIHHLYLVDFDRRELVYPIVQRVLGLGQETPDVTLPESLGIPVPGGHVLGLYLMWHNDTGVDQAGVRLELALRWKSATRTPEPTAVFPFFVDAHLALGGDWSFQIPPGGGSAAYEFRLPLSGRLRIVGGHLHDHGVALRLVDVTSGDTLVTLRARRDSTGRLLQVPYRILRADAAGSHLIAGHRYRLIATYDNPGTRPIVGVMGTFAGLLAPDDPQQWPPVDSEEPAFREDRDLLTTRHPGGGPQAQPGSIDQCGRAPRP